MGQRFQVVVGVTFAAVGVAMLVDGAYVAAGADVRDGRFDVEECWISGGKGPVQTCVGHVEEDGHQVAARYEDSFPPWTDESESLEVIWRSGDEPVTVLRAEDRIANPLVWPFGILAFAGAVMLPFMHGWPRWLRRTNAWLTSVATAAWLACVVAAMT